MKIFTAMACEKVIELIKSHTRQWTFSNSQLSNIVIAKQRNNKLYILYTGVFGKGVGQMPLRIKLTETASGTVLDCKFKISLVFKIFFISVFVCGFFQIAFSLFYENAGLVDLIERYFILLLIVAVFIALYFVSELLLFRKSRKETIDFLTKLFSTDFK